jgi:CBS-domain-containing membrane protein
MGETRPDSRFAEYFGRMRGTATRTDTRQPISVVFLSWAAAVIGIVLIAIPSLYVDLPISTRLFLIGSFGASAALLYGAPHSDFAQPRNLIIGQLVAALVGVTAYKAIGAHVGLAGAVAVATTIAILQVTHCLHPPAGATALIAVLGPVQVHRLGYVFVFTPVLTGSVILLAVALVVNNPSKHSERHYPTMWW